MSRGPRVIESDVLLLDGVFARGAKLTKGEARARYGLSERRFRKGVNELRLRGVPIISSSERGSRYHRATSELELEAFLVSELESRARDIEAQIRALRAKARDNFPPTQMKLAV